MLLLHEQTVQFQLQKTREQNAGMAFANKCISNQIMEPLNTINSYAEILLRKLEQRPEIVKLLEAIKCCNQMIKFNILDLQDISNIQKR